MNHASRTKLRKRAYCVALLALLLVPVGAQAQTCLSASDMEAAVRSGLEAAARRYFEMSAHGDTAALQQNATSAVATNFSAIENAVKENQADFTRAKVTVQPPFLLSAEGSEPLARAEFLCGVFGKSGQTTNSAVFVMNNLPPGKYGVTILDVSGGEAPRTLTMVLQQALGQWKLAGYYVRPTQADGHDGAWYAQRARDFKARGQIHNSWLYYHEAIALTSPVDFMSTMATDKLYDEMQAAQPNDVPVSGNAVDLNASGKIYRWTAIFPLAVGNDLDVVVKYEAADISNTQKTFEQNTSVIRAVVAKFPELREAFAAVVARAVDPSGHDYGSLLPMKDFK